MIARNAKIAKKSKLKNTCVPRISADERGSSKTSGTPVTLI